MHDTSDGVSDVHMRACVAVSPFSRPRSCPSTTSIGVREGMSSDISRWCWHSDDRSLHSQMFVR